MKSCLQVLAVMAVLVLAGSGCKGGPGYNVSAIQESDSVPEAVKKLVRAVADNDSVVFAQLVSYPLQRPYPLHDIENAGQMESYYSTIVDDSLRRVIAGSTPGEWSEYGWRGWSVRDGGYVWTDSLVYDIPYLSSAEQVRLKELQLKDITTLRPELRKDWTPLRAYRCSDGSVIRVDMRHDTEPTQPSALRLLIYGPGNRPEDIPTAQGVGEAEFEGTEYVATYNFKDEKGRLFVINAEPSDGTAPQIRIESHGMPERTMDLKAVYWLDLMKHDK